MNTEATARPWETRQNHNKNHFIYPVGQREAIAGVAFVTETRDIYEQSANAALIVRAVNRYDALEAVVEAAKALCACAVESEWSDAEQTGMGFLRAALAKLEERGE